MKSVRVMIPAMICLASSGCVAGPGGSANAANRTITGVALGSLLGGVVGGATGHAMSGVVLGAFAGGAAGAAINPNPNRNTRGYCYTVDQQGQPIMVDMDAAECKAAGGSPVTQGR